MQLVAYKTGSTVSMVSSMNGRHANEVAVIEHLSACSPRRNPTASTGGVVVTATGRSTAFIGMKQKRIEDLDRVDMFFDLVCQVLLGALTLD